MENTNIYLNIIIILLVILIILLIFFVSILAFIYFRKQDNKSIQEEVTQKRKKGYYCNNHPETHASGTCMICEEGFCENCLTEHDKLNFCSEHLRLYVENEWYQLETIETKPNDPEAALILFNFKNLIWKENYPSFIVTHYKINLAGDEIESLVTLHVKKQDGYEMTKRLASYKETN